MRTTPNHKLFSVNYIHNSQIMILNCTNILLHKFPDCIVNITPHRKSARTAIISPDWDFKKMGIGGLDKVAY